MSLKTKLATIIISMCLVISVLVVAVWSASNATVNLGGSISFTATNVYCTVSGQIKNATGTVTQPTTLEWNISNNTAPTDAQTATWSGNKLEFDDSGTSVQPIQIVITVTNKSAERTLKFKMTDTKNGAVASAYTVAYTYENNGGTSTSYTLGNEISVAKSTALVFTITVKLKDEDVSVSSTNYGYSVELYDQSYTG